MKIKHLLSTLLLGFALSGNAQSYELTVSSEPYNNLLGSTSLNNGMTWDDPNFEVPLGFDFDFFDQTYSDLMITDFGLGGGLISSTGVNDLFTLLTPYGADIIDRGYDFDIDEPSPGSLSNISYLLEGAAGGRILKVEWNNVGFYTEIEDDDVSTDFTNFQLWLYEGTNDIEVRFGMNSITNPEQSFDEETGTWVGLIESIDFGSDEIIGEGIVLAGNPAAPTANLISNFEQVSFLNGVVPEGTVYRFVKSMTSSVSDNLSSLNKITVFPNPATSFFNVTLDQSDYKINTIVIRDFTGKLIKEVEYTDDSIEVTELVSGIYVAEIHTNIGVVQKRIVKQ